MDQVETEYDKLIWPVMAAGRVMACWPLSKTSSKTEIYFRKIHLLIAFVTTILMVATTTADIFHQWNISIEDATECVLVSTSAWLSLARMITFSMHQEDMLYIVESIKYDWIHSSKEERRLLRENCLEFFKLAKYFIGTVAVTACCFFILPIIEIFFLHADRSVLPFRGYYYVNHTLSPMFEIIFPFNVFGGVFACFTIAGGTSFSLVSIMHGATRFTILQHQLRSASAKNKNGNRIVRNSVLQHQECIRYAEALERLLNFLILAQHTASTCLICMAGFQMTSLLEDKRRTIKYALFLNSAILQLFLFSLGGNKLKMESESVKDAAYTSNWFGGKFTKNLMIIMMRAEKPCTITAGKFSDTTLQSFSSVLSTSFSYFTVLKAVNEE